MKLCRFQDSEERIAVGLLTDGDSILDLTAAGAPNLTALLETRDLTAELAALSRLRPPKVPLADVRLLAPVERQEIWAAGVTYLRSKSARREESDFGATAYDRVYDADRPELFFKAHAEKTAGPGAPVGIRRDSRWNVPEPELALVINSRGNLAGCTIGNDMSSRHIEGENLLYLPQAKIYDRSCALGPFIVAGAEETEIRTWPISMKIRRKGESVFVGETTAGQMRRSFEQLVSYLFRCQVFEHGAVLLTGTGIVPPESFTLFEGDLVDIEIGRIGILSNPVITV